MKMEQFESLLALKKEEVKPQTFLWPGKPRTLLYGYDVDRNTWHVYVDDRNHICRFSYSRPDFHGAPFDVEPFRQFQNTFFTFKDMIPKRLYPEACDYHFCHYLVRRGIDLPFTKFNLNRNIRTFYGEVYE